MSRKFNAMLGLGALAAFGFASSAFAQCPSSPVPPWSSVNNTGGSVAISAGGYDGTSCKLDTAIVANLGIASGLVVDGTPADEPRYRAQFLINVDALTGQNIAQPVRVFAATTAAPANSVPDVVSLTVFGNAAGTAKTLGVSTACASSATFRCTTSVPLTGGTGGVHRVEIDWQKGAAGSLRVWVNSTSEGSPSATVNVDNSAWGGVDSAALGLTAASPTFRAVQANRIVSFDEFDSRRQTFIGN